MSRYYSARPSFKNIGKLDCLYWEGEPTKNPRTGSTNIHRPIREEGPIFNTYAKACYKMMLSELEIPNVFKQWETLVIEQNLKKEQLEHKFECLIKSFEKKLTTYKLNQSIFDIYSKMILIEKEKLLRLYEFPMVRGKLQVNRNKFGTILYPRQTRPAIAEVTKLRPATAPVIKK